MDHGQHGDQGAMVMQHESDGADDQMDHGHGKGLWMFEYEFMGMHMDSVKQNAFRYISGNDTCLICWNY
jgi:hypothetical protein